MDVVFVVWFEVVLVVVWLVFVVVLIEIFVFYCLLYCILFILCFGSFCFIGLVWCFGVLLFGVDGVFFVIGVVMWVCDLKYLNFIFVLGEEWCELCEVVCKVGFGIYDLVYFDV